MHFHFHIYIFFFLPEEKLKRKTQYLNTTQYLMHRLTVRCVSCVGISASTNSKLMIYHLRSVKRLINIFIPAIYTKESGWKTNVRLTEEKKIPNK